MGRTAYPSIEGHASGTRNEFRSLLTLRGQCAKNRRRGHKTFALSADVSEAHRQVPIAACDLYLLGCHVQHGSTVHVHKVGTFGVATASYYSSRFASAIGRPAQYLVDHAAHTWHLLVADDFLLEASGPYYREALIVFFLLCSSCNVPLSWNMTAGGTQSPGLASRWDLSEARRMADQMGERGRGLDVHSDEQIRGRTWQDRIRRRCPGI